MHEGRCPLQSIRSSSPTTLAERPASRFLGSLPRAFSADPSLTPARSNRFTHPVVDHYLEEILPHLPSSYFPTNKPAKKATQAQLDRMRDSFVARGITNERHLMALESLTRSERLDFGLVGATVRSSPRVTPLPRRS